MVDIDDAQWIALLTAQIEKQQKYAKEYDERYRGSRILPLVAREYREVYGNEVDGVLAMIPPRTGMGAIGIDALVDRMMVVGFDPAPAREGTRVSGEQLVAAAQAFWDGNDLDAMHTTAIREMLIASRSFGLVWPGADGRAVASIESADEVAVHRQTAPPYDVDASLKLRTDEWTGRKQAYLWVGGFRRLYEHRPEARTYVRTNGLTASTNWWLTEDGEERSPFGLVNPVVELAHWTRLLAEPSSAIEPVAPLIDEADLCEALQVFAGHFGAVPIRYATGLPVARDPKDPTGQTPLLDPRTGKPFVGFNARADHLWTSTSKDTQFGQLTPATLDGFVTWSDAIANKVRAKTAVPEFYYGTAGGSHITGETLKVEEAPMIRRVLGVRQSVTQGLRRIASLGLAVDVPGVQPGARTVLPRWCNPETRIEAQATDAFQKQRAAGVPLKVAMRETLGWAPEVIEEVLEENARLAREQATRDAEDPFVKAAQGLAVVA